MENSIKDSANTLTSTDLSCRVNNKINGLHNWALLFLAVSSINVVIDNYLSYGIIKTPVDLTYDFIGFMQGNWWCCAVLFVGYPISILLSFLNEKLLALDFLPEQLGMTLHVGISTLLFNVCAVLCLVYKFNPVAGVIAMSHLFLVSVKLWSYAYENKKTRDHYKKIKSVQNLSVHRKANSKDHEKPITIAYPENVTLKDLFVFMTCTGACVYKAGGQSRKPRNFKNFFAGLLGTVLIFYIAAFVIYQYIFPEAHKANLYINTGQHLKLFGSALKLALPINIVWLSYFYFYCFWFYLPVYGWLGGTEEIVTELDWWNSENITVFWTKWNYQTHMWFKESFFLPALRKGCSKQKASIIVGVVSGILHEYLICIPCRGWYGLAMFTMLAQIPLAKITTSVQKKFGGKWGNLFVWFTVISGHTASVILICYNYLTPK